MGEDVTCTFVNDDIAPKLTVIKTVINDDGGTLIASQFTINVSGTDVSDPSFPGDENGTMVTLDAGAYDVTEVNPFPNFYAESFSADCSGSIGIGAEKTCTITNGDIAAQGPSIIVTANPFTLDGTLLTGSTLIVKDNDVDDPTILATSFNVVFEYKVSGRNGGWFEIGATCTYDPAAPVEFVDQILVDYTCTLDEAVPNNSKSERVTFEVNIFGRTNTFSNSTTSQL